MCRRYRSCLDVESSRCERSRIGLIYGSTMGKANLQRHPSPSSTSILVLQDMSLYSVE